MSGQQVGAAIGFVVGWWFGVPQLGAAIGGMIGGWISPTQVNGPHIGDQSDQSSQEGQPIPWVIGTCGWIQGNIVDKSKVREVKKTDDGKGSGTEVNTFEAHQDFQIMICESSEHRESLMAGVLIVKVDGKIVYDMRPASNFGADNAKFLRNHTFYDGNEAQLPDPTMEALPHNGVGNTPYYRGVFTMVARDVNLSQYGERIPVYQFVMVGAGESNNEETISYLTPPYAEFIDASWPLADSSSDYIYYGLRVDKTSASHYFTGSSIEDIIDQASELYTLYGTRPSRYQGYSAASTFSEIATFGINLIGDQPTVVDNVAVMLIYNDFDPGDLVDVPNDEVHEVMCPLEPSGWVMDFTGGLSKFFGVASPEYYDLRPNGVCGGGAFPAVAELPPLRILVTRKRIVPTFPLGDPCVLGEPVTLPDAPEFSIDCEGNIQRKPTYEEVTRGDMLALQIEETEVLDGRTQFIKYDLNPVILTSDPNNTQEFWEAAAAAAGIPGSYGAGWPIPIGTATQATVTTESLTEDLVGLDTVLTRIAIRGGLTADDLDVSEMDQNVMGYMVTQSYTGADSMRPLMTAFKSYGSEYDAKIHFHKHGEDADLIIDPEDIIQGTEESDQTTRDQQVEFPRTYSITYIDATQDYTARPQVDRRISSDVRAIGEVQTQVAVVLPPDYARQLANVGMKVNWARAVGSREFSVPYAGYDVYLRAVAGKPFFMDSQRRIPSEISLQDGEIQFKGLYDRQSAYTSDIQATPALPPTPPPSNVGGVTLLALLNIGVLRDQDDRVGIYVAASGILSAWPGALLQVSYDDEASWQTAIASITQASTMGYLTADLPLAPASGDDVTNTLSVFVQNGQLNTITRLQYLNEGNPYAIVSNTTTGECELGAFQYAEETDPDEYNLTTLVRGGLSSTPAEHLAGTRFCMLDSVYFFEIPSGMIGRTIKFRAVTFGTAPENNAVYSILFQPAVSQTEWQATYLQGRYGTGSSFQLSVIPRHRLGNDVTPIASSNFTGYRWTADDGVSAPQVIDTVDPAATFDLSTLGSPVTFSVSLLNRITGPGPSLSIVL